MKKLREAVDRLACILPFEEPYFRSNGIDAVFVGHPLFDELPPARQPKQITSERLERPVIGLLPGSRRSEAKQNYPHLLEVASRLLKEFPGAEFLTPTTAATSPVVSGLADEWREGHPGVLLEHQIDAFDQLVPRCDLCLTVSGTATLHVASFGVPMIVVYRASRFVWHAAGRWIIRTRTLRW